MAIITNRAPKNFIFGYGSLICHESRIRTAPSLANVTAVPVMVQNLQRVWAARIDSHSNNCIHNHNLLGWTAVGVSIQKGKQCNGVLLPVDEEELQLFDQREKHYTRVLVDWNLIQRFGGGLLDDHMVQSSDVWVYAQENTNLANRYFPIPQSYVDVILRGCLSISREFCATFVETTQGWWWYEQDEISDRHCMEGGELAKAITMLEDAAEEEKKIETPTSPLSSSSSLSLSSSMQLDLKEHLVWIDDRTEPAYNRNDIMVEWTDRNWHLVDDILKRHVPFAFERRTRFY